jgi:cytidylate kinase
MKKRNNEPIGSNIIAIDGPAAAGKSTVAAATAKKLSAIYVSTGNMYRAVTLAALPKKIAPQKSSKEKIKKFLASIKLEYKVNGQKEKILLNGRNVTKEIRSPEVASQVSKMAAIPELRAWLAKKQREIVKKQKRIVVMEGRDIGTVVFPNAKYKFFLTATPEIRARRRLEQAGETPKGSTIATVAREIAERDKKDMNRKIAPLTKAKDAILIDSTDMSVAQVVNLIAKTVLKKKNS